MTVKRWHFAIGLRLSTAEDREHVGLHRLNLFEQRGLWCETDEVKSQT